MLTEVTLKNYRCFRDATIKLAPFTVLVGPNATGKSTMLNALNGGAVPQPQDFWHHEAGTLSIRRIGSKRDLTPAVETNFTGGFNVQVASPSFVYQLLHLDIGALRSENWAARARTLEENGSNLANVIASLSRKQQASLAKGFCDLVPAFQDLGAVPVKDGRIRLRFQDKWDDSVWYDPADVSDGSMLLAAYLTLEYSEVQPDIIAIDEPERGIHPYVLGELVAFLRRLSKGELGRKSIQVVLATHSAELLDHVEPEEVRFLSRDSKTGEVQIEDAPTNEPTWRESYKIYDESLGSMWLSGGLGGVPGA